MDDHVQGIFHEINWRRSFSTEVNLEHVFCKVAAEIKIFKAVRVENLKIEISYYLLCDLQIKQKMNSGWL